ncbi:unnamed protein product [Arctogadus glacialis]
MSVGAERLQPAQNKDEPQNDGRFCPGGARVNQLCSLRPCPPGAPGFRAQQCAAYNSKPFRGWFYRWRPYTKVDRR